MDSLDQNTLTTIKREFIQSLKDENLILIPAEYGAHVFELAKKQKQLLSQKAISAYKVAKHQLIPNVTTLRTVKNMVADGRISKSQHYHDKDGVLYIQTSLIKTLRQ